MFKSIVKGVCATAACLMLCCAAVSASEYNDSTKVLLKKLEIMTGDENGNFDDDQTLTREQFAKITVAIADPDYVVNNSAAPFFDVARTRWSAGYIDRSNKMGFFHGYPDGSFRPDEQIVPEQVCKVMLKLLGYENNDITGNWAESQISFAKNKGLLENVNYVRGVPMSRIEAAKIIRNTLFAQMKDSGLYLVETMGYSYFEDTLMLSDKNTQAGYVSTNNGVFRKTSGFSEEDMGKKGDVVVDKKGEIVCFLADNQNYGEYIVKAVSGDSVAVFGDAGSISGIADETLCYYWGSQMNFANMKQMLKTGDKLFAAYSEYGGIEYLLSSGNSMQTPLFVKDISTNENTRFIRDGVISSAEQIEALDVCYYLSEVNTVVAYSKKITGVFENAHPSKENISSITLSGRQYSIGHINAVGKLSSSGTVRYGDTVTLLFGKDDTVVDVVVPDAAETLHGVVLESFLKDRVDENGNRLSAYVIKFMKSDGSVSEYSALKDYDNLRGKAVDVSFRDGTASVTVLKSSVTPEGIFDWDKKQLGKYIVDDNVEIIDVCNDVDYTAAKAKEVFPQRLNGAKLSKDDIVYAEVNGDRITGLILNDYTKDLWDYGVALYAKNLSNAYVIGGEYKVNVNGRYLEFVSQNSAYNVTSGQPVMMELDGKKGVVGMKKLTPVSGKLTAVDELYAYVSGKKYLLSDSVIIYKQVEKMSDEPGYRFEIISKDKLDFEKNVQVYCDSTEENGGRVRVIVEI